MRLSNGHNLSPFVYRDASVSVPVTSGLANCSTEKDIQREDVHIRHSLFAIPSSKAQQEILSDSVYQQPSEKLFTPNSMVKMMISS